MTAYHKIADEIADLLPDCSFGDIRTLSPKTVETYRARMMQKLGINDFASLIRFAIQQGVSPLE